MDPWNKTAQTFYDEFGDQKKSSVFISAYRRILPRLALREPSSAAPLRALDLGCGTGELGAVLSEAGFQVTGVDISQQSLAKAKVVAPAVQFIEADMTGLPLPEQSQDAVFAMTSLEFCLEKSKVLREVKRVLKSGGFFYVEVRNRDFVLNLISGKARDFFTQLGILKVYPAESFKDFSYPEWKNLFHEAGFKVEKEYLSLRPWAYGGTLTRAKNLLIEFCKFLFPLRRQYMAGFLLR